jgi:diaminopimelate decarboxylase
METTNSRARLPADGSDRIGSIATLGQRSWIKEVDLLSIAKSVGTPVFLYSERQLIQNIERVMNAARSAGLVNRVELYVPFFPNANPHILRPLRDLGVGLLVQIPSEYRLLTRHGFSKFIVSPGHVSNDEIDYWRELGHLTFLASLDEVAFMLSAGASRVSVRIDSLGSEKPGIKLGQLEKLSAMLKAGDCQLECFEVYCGSGNSLQSMVNILEQVLVIFKNHFPAAKSINFAGGHGFNYEQSHGSEQHFNWQDYFEALRELANKLEIPENIKFLFEPARDVLADTGVLLLSVKRSIVSNPVSNLVVTDGSRMLMPSAQHRDRRHNIMFLDRNMNEITAASAAEEIRATVRGRTILRNDYILPGTYTVPGTVGCHDYMLIFDVGAYCATQHMEFLNVPPAPEVLIDQSGASHLITSRGNEMDKWRNLLPERISLSAHSANAERIGSSDVYDTN